MKAKKMKGLIQFAILMTWVFLPAALLRAQSEPGERGHVVVGYRHIVGDTSSAKFNEYRHVPRVYIQSFRLNLEDIGKRPFFFSFQSRDSVEKDQSHLLGFGRNGKFRLELRWDQAPHAFANSSKGLFLAPSGGAFLIPGPTRAALQAQPSAAGTLFSNLSPFAVTLRRNTGAGRFLFTPTAEWAIQVQYSREKMNGLRPLGTTTNSFTNVVELPEPIDYRTSRVSATAEFANRKWGLQIGYGSSLFRNRISALVWDIPFRTADTATAGSHGQLDLYPDNSASSFTIAGAVNLGESTRFMASIVPGWMRQDDRFLPFTVNSALTSVPELPASSLNAKKQTLAMNYTLASSIIPALHLTARYRSYDYNNDTPSLFFSNYIRTDASLGGVARQSLPYGYNRKNLGWDASWEFWKGQFVKIGYDWERFDRVHRDVPRSNEHTVSTSLDLNPAKWMLFRVSYRHGDRTPNHYEPNEESFPLGEPATALGQLHELRKFDEAARVRNRAETLLQLNFTDSVTFAASYGTTQDNFQESLYGLLSDINQNYGFELTYSPRAEISVFADYAREKYRYNQRSRQRTPTNDTANNDWDSHMRDLIDTWGAGVNLSFLRNRLLADTYYSLSAAQGLIRTRALGSSTIPGFLVTTAVNYPDTSSRLHQLNTTIHFRLSQRFSPRFDYRYERYGRVDFQTQVMQPYMVPLDASTSTSVFLGADAPPYKVHILGFSLEYRF